MAVCFFLSKDSGFHSIYDTNIHDRVQAAVDHILEENEDVTFLLHYYGGFYDICLQAVLKAKASRPERVTIAQVLSGKDHQRYMAEGATDISYCMVDEAVVPHVVVKGRQKAENSISYADMMYWMIQNSTHLISYLYESFGEAEDRFLDFARRNPSLKIISLTNSETEQAIKENITLLSSKRGQAFQSWSAGKRPKDIAGEMGVSVCRANALIREGRRALREEMDKRYRQLVRHRGARPVRSCAVFAPGEATYETLCRFEDAIRFLKAHLNVTRFYIQEAEAHSAFMYVLKRVSTNLDRHFIVSITDHKLCAEGDSIPADICGPWDALIRVEQTGDEVGKKLGLIANLIELSDLCLCDLSSTSLATEIREYASSEKGTFLLDISRTWSE